MKLTKNEVWEKEGRFIFAFICSINFFSSLSFFYLQDYFTPYFVRHVIHDSHLRDGVYAACRFCWCVYRGWNHLEWKLPIRTILAYLSIPHLSSTTVLLHNTPEKTPNNNNNNIASRLNTPVDAQRINCESLSWRLQTGCRRPPTRRLMPDAASLLDRRGDTPRRQQFQMYYSN